MCTRNTRISRNRLGLLPLALAGCSGLATADITFTQTVDGWSTNTYAWAAQNETVNTARGFDAIGTVKTVWARVIQKNGSEVGGAVFCTTMTKTGAHAFGDNWALAVPAGTLTDSDFWDCSRMGVEIVGCEGDGRMSYNSSPSPHGMLFATDFEGIDIAEDPNLRMVQIDPLGWDDQSVRDFGFDFAVYAYLDEFGFPFVLNHVDEVGLTCFRYDQENAFGTGEPYDPNRLVILGIDLDPSWDQMPFISNGLHFFDWQLQPGGGWLITDQGDFQILQVQPLFNQWQIQCPTDLTGEGTLDFFDVAVFLQWFSDGDPRADWNNDGVHDFFDVLGYLDDFSQGCP